jgi:hypothetical protein
MDLDADPGAPQKHTDPEHGSKVASYCTLSIIL